MAITLNYKHFEGRMFVVGYADECGVSGHNQDVTTLVLPITIDPRALNRCGIFVAHSVGYGNRYKKKNEKQFNDLFFFVR